jgi:perosamine synthetase
MIPISKPTLYHEDKSLAIDAINNGDIAHGKYIEEFETKFSSYCNRKFGVSCSNGTTALYIAIRALNLPKKTEVILPSMTIMSCLNAVTENDLVPVFCDIDETTLNVDFNSIRSKITNNTSAIIVVNTYGLVVDTIEIEKLKTDYPNIKIIEDASESHGGSHNQKIAGSIGDISTFSFYANKIITTGEGGMVLTDDEEVYRKLISLRNLNFIDRKKYIHSDVGFNFRMTNIQSAIGIGQLINIDKTIQRRREIANQYNDYFKNNSYIVIPHEDDLSFNVYWYYTIRINKNYNQVLKKLEQNEIDYRHFFYPLHKQDFIGSNEKLPVSEKSFDTGLILPTFGELTIEQISFISETVLDGIEN